MKILTLDKPESATARKISVDFYVDDDVQGQPMNQITVCHFNTQNPAWTRQVHVTGNYITASRYGVPTAGFHVDDLIKLLVNGIPEISWPPKFDSQPISALIKDGESAILSAKINSEIPVVLCWQQFDGKEWQNCTGCTLEAIETKAAGIYRVMAINAAGTTLSKEVKVHVTPPLNPAPIELPPIGTP